MRSTILPLLTLFALILPLRAEEAPKNPTPAFNDQGEMILPAMKKELVLKIEGGENNLRNSEGDFLRLENGDILYIYTHFYGESWADDATAYLASRRSSDEGKTWTTEDKIELPNEAKCNVMSVTCRTLANGERALFYLADETNEDEAAYVRFLQPDESWSDRIKITEGTFFDVVNNDRVIQLSSGRLLVPTARHHNNVPKFNNYGECFCQISDDNGRTWRKGQSVPQVEGVMYQEPGVCELADGRILLNIRTNAGSQFYCYSEDQGESWSVPYASCLDSPLSPTLIKRIPGSDELIAIGNPLLPNAEDFNKSRAAFTIARLSPDGNQILSRKVLEFPQKGIGWQYPAVMFLDNGEVLISYFSFKTEVGIRIYRINLADL